MQSAPLALVALALVLAAPPARAIEAIGPYAVEQREGALVVRAGEGDAAALALVAAGLVLASLGAARMRRARRRGVPWTLLGVGLAAVGGVARLEGGAAWTVTRDGVTETRRLRAERRVERAAIEAIQVAARRPTGMDAKASAEPRRVELRVLVRGDAQAPIRFAFERESDARRLGVLLAGALGAPLR